EVAVAQGRLAEYLDLCAAMGFDRIECGTGFTEMGLTPAGVVGMAAERGLEVQYEVGPKHGGGLRMDAVDPLIAEARAWLEAGARTASPAPASVRRPRMTPDRSVRITCFQDGASEPVAAAATVCVDVFRATTTAVTAVVAGRRCFPAGSLEEAVPLAAALHRPLLVGELGGNMPYGFDLQNSPAAVAGRPDVWRPAILLSTSGTPLLIAAARTGRAYA